MKVTVIGLGLIGGSVAMALKKNGMATSIIGVDRNQDHCKEAQALGIVDETLPMEQALTKAELVVMAIPVTSASKLIVEILDLIKEGTVVMDMGSTKVGICQAATGHSRRGQFVAAHPIAGTENSGPSAAFTTLMMDKIAIICEREKSNQDALSLVERVLKSLFMEIHYMTAEEHDKHIAYVSHLSHISSFALGLTVLDKEKNEENIFNMAGSGFASTVRLAKSSPEMWSTILHQNKDHLTQAVDAYITQLSIFRKAIEEEDLNRLSDLMIKANQIRKVLDK